jgi:3',5'-cyclic AMP phosphodiesterase CpdA
MRVTRRSFLGVVGTGAVAAALPGSDDRDKATTVPDCSFIQLTDTHIPDKSGVERSAQVVDAINGCSLSHQLVLHTGDVSNGRGKIEDMKAARDLLRFTKEAHFVPGNHDVTFDQPERHEEAFAEMFGGCNQTVSPAPGLRFALFNSQSLSDRASPSTRQKAFEALEKMLDPPMFTILFCHATGLPDFYNNEMHDGWPAETMIRWVNLMKQGGVEAVLAGHFHRDEQHVVNGIPFCLCAPVVGWWGRQSTFRHWQLKDGALSYRTVYVG